MKLPRLHPAPFIGLLTVIAVLALFNAQLIAAYASMWTQPTVQPIAPEKVVAARPSENPAKQSKAHPAVPQKPLVLMPSAGIKAPVVYDVTSVAETDVQRGLQRGVLHFGDTALPGEKGNAVFVGHSSGQPWAPGDYKFVFTMLQRLKAGDKIQLTHQGELYVYQVTEKTIVVPSNISVLEPTDTPTATFITCWPVGVNAKRLVVKSELVSDNVQSRSSASDRAAMGAESSLPGAAYGAGEALRERF